MTTPRAKRIQLRTKLPKTEWRPFNKMPGIAKNELIDELLAERGATHGDYADHARITQRLKSVMHEELSWYAKLTPTQRESLDMIAHKVGRILAGDPNHKDHWVDLAGYAQLVAQRL